jgi:hypothetical protein
VALPSLRWDLWEGAAGCQSPRRDTAWLLTFAHVEQDRGRGLEEHQTERRRDHLPSAHHRSSRTPRRRPLPFRQPASTSDAAVARRVGSQRSTVRSQGIRARGRCSPVQVADDAGHGVTLSVGDLAQRTNGRLLAPSTPVTSSTFPARPPQPSWRIRLRISRIGRSRCAACTRSASGPYRSGRT